MSKKRHRISRRSVLVSAGGMAAVGFPLLRTARAQSQRKKDHVNIVSTAGNVTAAFNAMMFEQGFFDKFYLDTKPVFVTDAPRAISSLVSGEMDICSFSGFSDVLTADERGADLKVTNGSLVLGQQTVISAKPEIKSVKGLVGKTIGVGSLGANLHQLMVAVLLKEGVDPSTVRFANVGSTADIFRAVVQKTVDAGPAQIDVLPILAKSGAHSLEDGDVWTHVPEYPAQAGFADGKAIKEKREILVRTLAAYETLFRFLSGPDSKDAWRSARRTALNGSGQAFDDSSDFQWEWFQKNKPFARDLILSPTQVNYLQALNLRMGAQKVMLRYEKVADMSLARDAVKLL